MKPLYLDRRQRGVALVVSLLFLLVVTLITVVAATNSSRSFKMAANMQDMAISFQTAESGVYAALGMGIDIAAAQKAADPFNEAHNMQPFTAFTSHPLRDLPGQDSVTVEIMADQADDKPICPLPGSSVGTYRCEYYRVRSMQNTDGQSRTRVELGVVKPVIGGIASS